MDSVAGTLTTTVMTAVALAGMHGSVTTQTPICVVIQDHATVPRAVLGSAIQIVTNVYRPLGIGIVWIEAPLQQSGITRVYLRILPRTGGRDGDGRMLGIDAPAGPDAREHLAHILYRRIEDDIMTSNALAYVMARLIGGALQSPDALSRPTLVYADRNIARQMVKGASVFGLWRTRGRSNPKGRRGRSLTLLRPR